jgi:zinc transport system substrate-binding protein
MNKFLVIIIVILAVLGGVFLFNKNAQQGGLVSNKMQVNATFYPLYYFASEIGGDKVEVHTVTPAGVEPHDYDPTAKDIAKIQKGKVLIVNGAGFEPWVEKVKEDLKQNNVAVVDASEGLELVEGEEEHHDEGTEHQEEAASAESSGPLRQSSSEASEPKEEHTLDPHVWLSPVMAKSQVKTITKGLVQADPANKDYYEKNAAALEQKLDALHMQYKTGLQSCQQRNFVTSHAAFAYLAREYDVTMVPISGVSPDEDPSAKQLAEVATFAKENNVKYIFFETLVSPKLSETIANEVGAKTLVLDPIEGISDDDRAQGKNYFTVMEANLENLQIAMECNK